MTQEPESDKPKLTIQEQLINFAAIVIKNGGLVGGGAGAAWVYFKESDIPKAIASALFGLLISYGGTLLKPIDEGNKRRLKAIGDAADQGIDRVGGNIAASWQSLGFEAKYLKCQEWDCHEDNVVGMREDDNLPINNPLLSEVFVPLALSSDSIASGYEFRDRGEDCQQMQIWELLSQVKQDNRLRQISIRAWGGYGKSTLLKHLAYIYSTGEYGKGEYRKYKAPKFVPFLLYLTGCWQEITKENPPNLIELLTTFHIGRLNKIRELEAVPPSWVQNLLRRGEALVMFDGFDEVPPVERVKVSEWISGEMQKYHEAVFIVTSRPTAFREDYVARKPTASFWIQDFTQEQRKQFVEQWYFCQERYARGGRSTPDVEAKAKERAQSLLEQIQARPELNDIAGNVLLLNMMARFHRDNKLGRELPQRKVELYQEICELQLGRRAKARGIELVLTSISQRQEVLQFIALEMMFGATEIISGETAIDSGDREEFKQITLDNLLELIKTALAKIDPDVNAMEFISQMEQVSELLVKKDDSIYQFSHLSFQEFLAAAELVRLKSEGERLIFKCLGVSAWKDLILFYAGLVNPTRIIQEAISQNQVDLAYLIYQQTEKRLNLSSSEQKALETLKPLIKNLRYQQLEDYLKNKQWKKADYETYRLMITAVGKDAGQWFSEDDLKNFPCDDLLTIDRLWVDYSKQHGFEFGLSVQKQIYVECDGRLDFCYPSDDAWIKFCDRTAWKSEGNWVNYPDQFFLDNFIKVKGHLPFGAGCGLFVNWGLLFSHRKL